MKRAVKVFIAVYCVLFMCFFGGMTAFAWDVDIRYQNIELKNAPAGTAFADILVKDRKNDKYAADFNEENARLLGVTKDCGLAAYDKDCCTSMLLRHNCAVFDKADLTEHSVVCLKLNVDNNKLFNHFRKIKVAYCDRDGNVLAVTDEVKLETVVFNTPAAYIIQTDGEMLSCRISTGPPYYLMVVVPVLVLVPAIVLIAVIIAVRVRRKAETSKMIKRIQSGEADNERKE